jgi:Nuclease-related domain
MRTLLTLGVLAAASDAMGRRFGWQDPRFLGAEVGLLAAIFAISRWVLPLVERHDRGALGEEHVGRLLDGGLLEHGWHVVHDASFGHGNVDHIVIGPCGVFTVETKSHPGPIYVRRLHGAVLGQAQAQRRVVEAIVGEQVDPLVVYSRAWVDRPLSRRKGVRVVPAAMLLSYLERQTPRLNAEQVALAHERLAHALADTRVPTHPAWLRRRPLEDRLAP